MLFDLWCYFSFCHILSGSRQSLPETRGLINGKESKGKWLLLQYIEVLLWVFSELCIPLKRCSKNSFLKPSDDIHQREAHATSISPLWHIFVRTWANHIQPELVSVGLFTFDCGSPSYIIPTWEMCLFSFPLYSHEVPGFHFTVQPITLTNLFTSFVILALLQISYNCVYNYITYTFLVIGHFFLQMLHVSSSRKWIYPLENVWQLCLIYSNISWYLCICEMYFTCDLLLGFLFCVSPFVFREKDQSCHLLQNTLLPQLLYFK